MNALDFLRCPICGGIFIRESSFLRCENGHCFDLAKEGYVNLLPPGKGKNAHMGDDKEMIRARQTFLSSGLYAPISDGIIECISSHMSKKTQIVLCDSGCGEGWHTLRITKALANRLTEEIISFGFDASKSAAAYASKASIRYGYTGANGIGSDGAPLAVFCPANIFSLPLVSESADLVLSMFAPVAANENYRLLHHDGFLLTVSSGIHHLDELRSLLYDNVYYHEENEITYDGFSLVHTGNVRYTMHVPTQEMLRALWTMTPFYYKTSIDGKERLLAADSLDITVDVRLCLYRKQ